MDKFTISIFRNKTFLEILGQINLFSKYKIKHFDDLDLCVSHAKQGRELVIFFVDILNKNFSDILKINNFPMILVSKSLNSLIVVYIS